MYIKWKTRYESRDRTTKEHHEWLKQNYKEKGVKAAATLLEEIINQFMSN